MAQKSTKTLTFLENLAKHVKKTESKARQVAIAKKLYFVNHRDEIIQAWEVGYTFSMIAEVATAELLGTGIFKSYTVKNKDGEETTRETKIYTTEIKKFCESETDK